MWAVEDDLAARCRLSLRDLHRWCWREDGTYWLSRLRVKWAVDDLAERQRMRQPQARHRWDNWLGGDADPDDSVAGWADDGCPEAA